MKWFLIFLLFLIPLVSATPWDVTSATNLSNISIAGNDGAMAGIFLNSSGTGMFLVGSSNDRVYSYKLSTPWDITTATNLSNISILGNDGVMNGIFLNSSGTGMFLVGSGNDRVYSYLMPDVPVGGDCWGIMVDGSLYVPNGCTYYIPDGSTGYFL